MTFFKGHQEFKVDAKGRVSIPAKMRKSVAKEANDTFAVTRGLDGCIEAYPLDEWKKKEEQYEKLNQYDPKIRFYLRTVSMWTEEVALDSQQRIMLPKSLLDFAKINKDVLVLGNGDHIEFWDPEEHKQYLAKQTESIEAIAETLMGNR